jgi:phospholipid/cholesterol/gamma-HCH transport system permease protein
MASSSVQTPASGARVRLDIEPEAGGGLALRLTGRLDAESTGEIWRQAMAAATSRVPQRLRVDADGIHYLDGSGAALLLALRLHQERAGRAFSLDGLRPELARLLALFERRGEPERERPAPGFLESVGRGLLEVGREGRGLLTFVGEITAALAWALLHPTSVRWRDTLLLAQRAGSEAMGIVALVGFLFGLILSFQSATALERFGAQVFIPDGLGIGLFRELGAVITAILLTGRSGSAFAAEIGTMKVNQEIDALSTMGLDPVRFLVVPRVLAAVAVMPFLILIFDLAALVGGVLIYDSLGYSAHIFYNRLVASSRLGDFIGGLGKGLVFAALVAAAGCLRGIQTRVGASAVGVSTTRAVVSGIVLIVVADGIMAAVLYALGI